MDICADIDVLLVGKAGLPVYPLRYKFSQLVEAGRINGTIRKHPGYFAKEWKKEYWTNFTVDMEEVKKAEKQVPLLALLHW